MTIIRPSLHRNQLFFLAVFFGILILGGLLAVFEYKAIADARYEIRTMVSSLTLLKTENAELKNRFYAGTEIDKLEALALERGLMLDKTPDYMSSNQWLS